MNPVYFVMYDEKEDPIPCFSKLYNNLESRPNPFTLNMTCPDAEANCPYIPAADVSISQEYEDPKLADGTVRQTQVYKKRNLQIAT